MDKEEMLTLRLEGESYSNIAAMADVSRQRIQQILSPPKIIRDIVISRTLGRCVDCGIYVGNSGHVHHKKNDFDYYQDIDNLELLCISCHRKRHSIQTPERIKARMKRKSNGAAKTSIQLKVKTVENLSEYGMFGETYDDIISRIIQVYSQEGCNGKG